MFNNLFLRIALRNTNNKRIRTIRIVRQAIRRQNRTTTHNTSTFVKFSQLSHQLYLPVTMNSFTNRHNDNRQHISRTILNRRTSITINRTNRFIITLNRMIQETTLNSRRQRRFTRNRTFINRNFHINNNTHRNFVNLIRINTMPSTRAFNRTICFAITKRNKRQRTIRMVTRRVLPHLRNLQPTLVNTRTNEGRLPGLLHTKRNRTIKKITVLLGLHHRNTTTNQLAKRIRSLHSLQPHHRTGTQPISNKINRKLFHIRRRTIFSRRRTISRRQQGHIRANMRLLQMIRLVRQHHTTVDSNRTNLSFFHVKRRGTPITVARRLQKGAHLHNGSMVSLRRTQRRVIRNTMTRARVGQTNAQVTGHVTKTKLRLVARKHNGFTSLNKLGFQYTRFLNHHRPRNGHSGRRRRPRHLPTIPIAAKFFEWEHFVRAFDQGRNFAQVNLPWDTRDQLVRSHELVKLI